MKSTLPALALLIFTAPAWAADWPEFRGPTGQGTSEIMNAPLKWSENSDNIRWKAPVEGLGWSSPVIADREVWLTTATDEGRSFRAVCLDVEKGDQIVDVEIFNREKPLRIHKKNSHASPTALIKGDHVYVHFGTYGTACLSRKGDILWKKEIEYRHVHGPGGSPVVYEDLLIFSCDGGDQQFVIALDRNTGEEKWRTLRPMNSGKQFAFSTPLLIDVGGKTQVVAPGAGHVVAYEPTTGEEIWRVQYPGGYSVVPRPVFAGGMVFVSSSYDRPRLLAIRPDGTGDITESHVPWILERGAPHNPSPLAVGKELYLVSDRGIATCVDQETGEQHWQERLGGNYSASPLYVAGRIYFLDENGATTVIRAGKQFEELAKNEVSGRTLASLTPVPGAMLLRTDTHLYRIDVE